MVAPCGGDQRFRLMAFRILDRIRHGQWVAHHETVHSSVHSFRLIYINAGSVPWWMVSLLTVHSRDCR
jgi:hypothetical protein